MVEAVNNTAAETAAAGATTTTTTTKTAFELAIASRLWSELQAFIRRTLASGVGADNDEFWVEFSDQIDVQFSRNDDPESPAFGQMEFFAYPIITDDKGRQSTDTTVFVAISLADSVWTSATLQNQSFRSTGKFQTSAYRGETEQVFEGELAYRGDDGEAALINLTRKPKDFPHDFVLLNV